MSKFEVCPGGRYHTTNHHIFITGFCAYALANGFFVDLVLKYLSLRKNSSPKSGYQKLSSSSFAEERVGREGRGQQREVQLSHARTGSSPASMIGQ